MKMLADDFFPTVDWQDRDLHTFDAATVYADSDEDRFHSLRLQQLTDELEEQERSDDNRLESSALPFNAEADQQRWNELEAEFERSFDRAAKQSAAHLKNSF